MGKRLWALIRKEFIQIRRDKRTLAMMIVIPVVWLTMFGYAATFDVKHIPTAVANLGSSPLAAKLVDTLEQNENFSVDTVADRAEIEDRLRRGTANIGLIIPADFGSAPAAGQDPAQAEILVDGSDFFSAQAGLRALSPILQNLAAELAAQRAPGMPLAKLPVMVPKTDILYNPELRSANMMIPGLSGLVILFITSMMTALGIVREKEHGTLEQVIVSPIRPLELMLGKLIPYTLIGLFDFALVITAGIYIFDVPFAGNLLLFTGLATLFLLSTLGIGLLVSTLADNQQQAIQMSMFMVFPQFLVSGMIFPLSAMPDVIHYIAYFFPLTYFMPIARGMFLKGVGLDVLLWPAVFLGIYGVAMIAFASVRFRKRLG